MMPTTRNIVESAAIVCRGPEIAESDIILPNERTSASAGAAFFQHSLNADGSVPLLREVEQHYVTPVLRHLGGQRMAAAQALGISYRTFLKYVREGGGSAAEPET